MVILNNRKGFTLMEILVATVLLGILMGLVYFWALIQGDWFVRNGQMMVRAQETARTAMSPVSQDLSESMFVYDTGGPIYCPMLKADGTGIWVDTNGNYSQMRYAKVDMILPRMKGYCTAPNSVHDPSGLGRTRAFDRIYTYLDSGGNLQTDPNLVEAAPRCPYDGTLCNFALSSL